MKTTNKKKDVIAIMTHDTDERADALRDCLKSLFKYTDTSDWDIVCYCDGYSKRIKDICGFCNIPVKFTYSIIGCGHNVNRVWEDTKDREFTLFLEGDWILLNHYLGDIHWLDKARDILRKNPDVSSIRLRFMRRPMENRQFCGFWPFDRRNLLEGTEKLCKTTLYKSKNVIYTNNPHLRRNKDYETHKVLPLDVKGVETKHTEYWCQSEHDAESRMADMVQMTALPGVFIHREFIEPDNKGSVPMECPYKDDARCLYGFSSRDPEWCESCRYCERTYNLNDNEEEFLHNMNIEL